MKRWVGRRHDGGTTPYQRMLESGALVGARRAVLERLYLSLNPLWLSRQIDPETEKLPGLAWRQGDRYPGTLPVTVILRSRPSLGNHYF